VKRPGNKFGERTRSRMADRLTEKLNGSDPIAARTFSIDTDFDGDDQTTARQFLRNEGLKYD